MATDTAVATITVEPTVTAVDDSASTQAGQAVIVPVLANDMANGAPATVAELDGPPTVVAIRPAGAGTATVDPETGDIEFTPAEGFCGLVEIDYEIERTCETDDTNAMQFEAGEGSLWIQMPAGTVVDWGDGSPPTTLTEAIHEHVYDGNGPYVASVTVVPQTTGTKIVTGAALLGIASWGDEPLGDAFSFYSPVPRVAVNLSYVPDTAPPGVTDMSTMFRSASAFNGDISGWDTSAVTNMTYMFYAATAFNGDISGWDTGSATSMSFMFQGASSFNQDLSGWCVEQISTQPALFAANTPAWTLPKPNWGAPC